MVMSEQAVWRYNTAHTDTAAQPSYETRVEEGRIQVRRRP